jgi:hypothetical protein
MDGMISLHVNDLSGNNLDEVDFWRDPKDDNNFLL